MHRLIKTERGAYRNPSRRPRRLKTNWILLHYYYNVEILLIRVKWGGMRTKRIHKLIITIIIIIIYRGGV